MINQHTSARLSSLKLSFLFLLLSIMFYSCNVDEIETIEQSSQYSFYFENDISKKELQNRVKLFNQFYRDSVTIKISEISYLNGQLDSYTISRKFPDETNFKIGATIENQAYKDKRPNLLSFKNQKIILRTSSNFRFELSKDLNAGIYKTEDK